MATKSTTNREVKTRNQGVGVRVREGDRERGSLARQRVERKWQNVNN
jgi:hypothetical protein